MPKSRSCIAIRIIALRKQNLAIYDISRNQLHGKATRRQPGCRRVTILKEEGFARTCHAGPMTNVPSGSRPTTADVADVRQLDLQPHVVPHQVRRPVPVLANRWPPEVRLF